MAVERVRPGRRLSPSHVTTARFDADLWSAVVEQAGRLDVARAELIRAAVREYVARLAFEDRISVVEGRLARVERVLVRVARHDAVPGIGRSLER